MYLARGVVSKICAPKTDAGSKQILKGYVNISKFTGIDVGKESLYWGTDSVSAPSQLVWLGIGFHFLVTGNRTLQFRLERTFYVKFFNPKQLDDSI